MVQLGSCNTGAGRLLGNSYMVFTGFSVVPDVGFKQKQSGGSETGSEHLETPWKYSASAKGGRIGTYSFQSFAQLFIDLSSINLREGFAPLHLRCGSSGAVAAACSLGGVCFLYVFVLRWFGQTVGLWEASHRQFV